MRYRFRRVLGRRLAVLLLSVGATGSAGCYDYHWTNDLRLAEQRARAEQRSLFIYYKYWLSDDSNRMFSETLSDARVARQFTDTINCLMDFQYPPHRVDMARYGVRTVPASVIVAPDGNYLSLTGYVGVEPFLEFVRRGKSPETARLTQPKRPPEDPSRVP